MPKANFPQGTSPATVRNVGSPKICYVKNPYTGAEIEVQYQEHIFITAEYGIIQCINDGQHFTFLDPVQISPLDPVTRRWFALCSCGSPAQIIGSNPVAKHTSGGRYMLACSTALAFNEHADGSRGYGA